MTEQPRPTRTIDPASPLTRRLASRRMALTGAATLGVGVPLLAACGASTESATDSSSGTTASSDPSSSSGSSSSGTSTGALASTSDIEVGGGTVFSDAEVVVVQPTSGEFKGYSAVCTHQGCLVGSVTSEGIVCPCHNSVFSLDDGSPTSGPADSPLEAVELTVTGDQITLA